MQLLNFQRTAVVLTLLLFSLNIQAQKQTKPNIIFILSDDIGSGVITANGGQSYSTPAIDSMAHHGMSFTHCESTPLCSPSRIMFLTGKQNYRNYSNWGYMSDTSKTVANMLQDAGYVTGIFGKLQLPCTKALMRGWGWSQYTIFEASNDSVYTDTHHSRYKSPTLIDDYGLLPQELITDKYCDDILTDRIKSFIDSNRSRPFFAYYSMSIGHSPFCPTPDDPEYASWDPFSGKSDTKFFPSMVHYMDKKVAEILDKLKSTGLDKNTVVIFCGDNGTHDAIKYIVNGKTVSGEKGKTLEGGTNVPLIAYCARYSVPKGITKDNLIDFTDFFPTFADIAQYHQLNKYGPLDGLSFYKTLLNQPDTIRDYSLAHYDPGPGADIPSRWARDLNYKLYDTTGGKSSGNFYNIINDPQETKPLADAALTTQEKVIKNKFLNVFKTFPTLPTPPSLSDATVEEVTNRTIKISGLINSTGETPLIERGTTLSATETPVYVQRHIADSLAALGRFYQTRNNLNPQTFYMFSVYAMNRNPSYSTGYAFNSFITLSNPPVNQPTSYTISENNCVSTIKWSASSFPKTFATQAGYLLVYSKTLINNIGNINGHSPAAVLPHGAFMVNNSATLPALPATQAAIANLSNSIYHCFIIPYTWDGKNAGTYNYLTEGALHFTFKPSCSNPIAAEMPNTNLPIIPLSKEARDELL